MIFKWFIIFNFLSDGVFENQFISIDLFVFTLYPA